MPAAAIPGLPPEAEVTAPRPWVGLDASHDLIEPPTWMVELRAVPDIVELVDLRSPVRGPTRPAGALPYVPRPARPHLRGDALRLAELALRRGDAFDAAAQLRALLADASPEARPYLELQLCRAYVALGRFEDAERILVDAIDRGAPSSWPAVFELATIRVRDRGADPMATWRELSPLVSQLELDLARHLMRFTSDPRALASLRDVLPPDPPDPRTPCVEELAAFEAEAPLDLPSWGICPAWRSPRVHAPRAAKREQLTRIALEARYMQMLLRSGRETRVEDWLFEANQVAEIVSREDDEKVARLLSWLAMLGYQNAAIVAARSPDTWQAPAYSVQFAREHVELLHPAFRDHARRIADSFLPVTP